ncbi:MAG TPA: hypothetical protein ENI87_13535 [bacterium]|nr:hypothetical protein [bacterium]
MEHDRLGAILLEGGIVDEAGLQRCLAIQALTGYVRPLGRILVEQGLLQEATLERLLAQQRSRGDARSADVAPDGLAARSLLAAAQANGATEVVVSEGRPVRIRAGARWRQLTDDVLSGPEVWDFVRETMGVEVLEKLAEEHFVVRTFTFDGVGCGRATAFRHFDGVAVRMAFSTSPVPEPHALGVPRPIVDLVGSQRGLVLCAGERGEGRQELLASLTRLLASDQHHYVVVLDDEPMELPTDGAMVVRRRFGDDAATRAAALRSVVREDPDAIVVGDVGAPETLELALRAAEGGRLVVAWLDAANVVAALRRVSHSYPAYELPRVRATLAAVLRAVLVRVLVPGHEDAGAQPATELLVVDEAAREVLRGGDLSDLGLLLRAKGGSSHALDDSLLELLGAGSVDLGEVLPRAADKVRMLDRAQALGLEAN